MGAGCCRPVKACSCLHVNMMLQLPHTCLAVHMCCLGGSIEQQHAAQLGMLATQERPGSDWCVVAMVRLPGLSNLTHAGHGGAASMVLGPMVRVGCGDIIDVAWAAAAWPASYCWLLPHSRAHRLCLRQPLSCPTPGCLGHHSCSPSCPWHPAAQMLLGWPLTASAFPLMFSIACVCHDPGHQSTQMDTLVHCNNRTFNPQEGSHRSAEPSWANSLVWEEGRYCLWMMHHMSTTRLLPSMCIMRVLPQY